MSAPGGAPGAGGPDGPSPTRRSVLEGLAVAVVGGVAGFAWFSAVGPPSEDERDRLEDERDDLEDRREEEQERLEDLQDDGGPDRGSGRHG